MEQSRSRRALQAIPAGEIVGGRYWIEAAVSTGERSVVYRAVEIPIERRVAIRVFAAGLESDAEVRLLEALKARMRLRHPSSVHVFAYDRLPDGRNYVVMEFVDGVSLRDELRRGAMDATRTLRIVAQCCASLAEAHALGILHLALKPEKVFLLTRGRQADVVKLTGHGSASVLERRGRLKPRDLMYVSREETCGGRIDMRSDLYALGILAFEMLSGWPLFGGNDTFEVLATHKQGDVPPLVGVPREVEGIVMRALARMPEDRFQSAAEMMRACQDALVRSGVGLDIPWLDIPMMGGMRGGSRTLMAAAPIGASVTFESGRETGVAAVGAAVQSAPIASRRGNAAKYIVGAVVAGSAAVAAVVVTLTNGSPPGGDAATVGALGAGALGAGALGLRPLVSATNSALRRVKGAMAKRTVRHVTATDGAVGVGAEQAPPNAIAYRPSWVLPRRQSAIHVYVVMPEVQERVEREAVRALSAPGNAAQGSVAIGLMRRLVDGERVVVEVALPGFDVEQVEPVRWRAPCIRFVVGIRGRADVALGVHRPIATVRAADGERDVLARMDFELHVRARSPRAARGRVMMVAGCAMVAAGTAAATVEHAVPAVVGWPLGAACVVGGAGGLAMGRAAMVPAEVRDRRAIAVAYAAEDRERVLRAIALLQAQGRFPRVEVERVLAEASAVEEADRVYVFWSERARASSAVKRQWQAAVQQAGEQARHVTSIVMGHDRLEDGHPLARFESVDLGALVDALIVTAVKDEYDAVLAVETGAVAGSAWQRRVGPARLEVAFREFAVEGGVLRVAVTQALGMGGVNAATASAGLIEACGVRCLAMCGVCAGRRGDVELGDVIVADRLWQYDAGKRKVTVNAAGERHVVEQADIDMYKIEPPAWKQAAERFALEPAAWQAARPRSYAAQAEWILERLVNGADPARDADQRARCPDYDKAIARLWAKGWLVDGALELTEAGRAHIGRVLTQHRGQLPEPGPLRVHIGPIASGNQVMEDAEVFPLLSDSVRKVLGVEMEAAAIGALANGARLPYSVVMKAVMDHADADKSDNFKRFAARASAEYLVAFLRKHLPPRTPAIP